MDRTTHTPPKTGKSADQDVVQRSRLRVDSRKWLLSKILPKQFGEKIDVNHSGELNLAGRSDDDLKGRLAIIWGTIAGIPGDHGGTGAWLTRLTIR